MVFLLCIINLGLTIGFCCKDTPNDLQRIVRALTVYYQTGIPFSKIRREKKRQRTWNLK